MRVLINAVSVREGGSLVMLNALLKEFVRLRPDWEWLVTLHENAEFYAEEIGPRVVWLPQPDLSGNPLKLLLWYHHTLLRLIRINNVDLLFSQTNYLPLWPVGVPTMLLEQHAGHFSPLFQLLTMAKLSLAGRLAWYVKGGCVRASARRADLLTVQTNTLAESMAKICSIPLEDIRVIPHGPGLLSVVNTHRQWPGSEHQWRIGYTTKYGVQKNFTTFFAAIKILLAAGRRVVAVLTLDEDLEEFQYVREQLAESGVAHAVENLGRQLPTEMLKIYHGLDLFVFPSLCESFGFPSLEAMTQALPMVVADIPENREMCGEAAFWFAPQDAAAIAAALEKLMDSPEVYNSASKAALERAGKFTWQESGQAMIKAIEGLSGMDSG